MFHSFTTSAVSSATTAWASGASSAAEAEGSFLAQPPFWGVVAVVASALAYTGVWRGWSRTPIKSLGRVPFPFGIGFFGVGILIAAIPVPYPANRIVVYFALALMMFSVIGVLWLPSFLLPRWFKEEMGKMRDEAAHVVPEHPALNAARAQARVELLTGAADEAAAAASGARILDLSRERGGSTLLGGFLGGALTDSQLVCGGSHLGGGMQDACARAFVVESVTGESASGDER